MSWGRVRKYPRAKVGDVFGSREVIALLHPDATRNERVRTRCKRCGHESETYLFNLREARPTGCNRCPRARTEGSTWRVGTGRTRERVITSPPSSALFAMQCFVWSVRDARANPAIADVRYRAAYVWLEIYLMRREARR